MLRLLNAEVLGALGDLTDSEMDLEANLKPPVRDSTEKCSSTPASILQKILELLSIPGDDVNPLVCFGSLWYPRSLGASSQIMGNLGRCDMGAADVAQLGECLSSMAEAQNKPSVPSRQKEQKFNGIPAVPTLRLAWVIRGLLSK